MLGSSQPSPVSSRQSRGERSGPAAFQRQGRCSAAKMCSPAALRPRAASSAGLSAQASLRLARTRSTNMRYSYTSRPPRNRGPGRPPQPPEPRQPSMSDPDPLQQLLEQTVQHALAYRRSLAERPVAAIATADALLAALAAPLPEAGVPAAQVVEELVASAGPGLTAMSGPRFFGWVTGGTLPSALAADWLTSVWDQNAGPASGAPAAAAFELLALRWVAELLGLPAETRGALVSGATMANLAALAGARSKVLAAAGWDVERDGLFGAPALRVLVGRERHASIDKALRVLGLG